MSNEIIREENVNVKINLNDARFESWDDEDKLNLKQPLLRGIYSYGFEEPSPIQQSAIIPLIKRKDVIAQAQSGTGKTGAFVIGSLQLLDEKKKETQTLILAHTRELARQIFAVINNIGNLMEVTTQLLIGGTSTELDREKLEMNTPHIVVGCPGRVHDMIRRKYLKSTNIRLMIIK